MDESQPSGNRTYITAQRLLSRAHENHNAFLDHVNSVGFSTHAPFNLLRPVMECSLWALWLLDPEEGLERRRRGLKLDIDDHRQEVAYLQQLGRMSGVGRSFREAAARRAASVVPIYTGEAEALETSFADLKNQRLNLVDSISEIRWLTSRYDKDTTHLFAAEWRRLSGYEHGRAWVSVHGSDQEVIAKVPGGVELHLTASDQSIQLATSSANLCLLEAARLYTRRSSRVG